MQNICLWIVVFLIVVGIPASLLFLIIMGVTKKKVIVPIFCLCGCFVLIVFFTFLGTFFLLRSDEYKAHVAEWRTEQSMKSETARESKEIEESVEYSDTLLPGKYLVDFVQACEVCGMDFEKVKDIKKIADWSNGQSYSFLYENGELYNDVHSVRFFDNGKVAQILYKQDDTVILYEYGYEALNINDFYVDLDIFNDLFEKAKTIVESSVDNSETIEFGLSNGGVFRYEDYYWFRSDFEEKNLIGKRIQHEFIVICSYDENQKYELLCYALDGEVLAGEPMWPEYQREQIPMLTTKVDGTILLTYGFIGDYGKTESENGEENIRYYLPEGRYKVTCQTRGSGLNLERNDASVEGEQILFSNTDEEFEIEIREGDSISLVEYSLLEFKPITK